MEVLDQLNRTVSIPEIPRRVISLVPSQTELLVSLGLEDRLVGVTKFCVHPSEIRKQKAIIGGTKTYRMEKIAELEPDLIIGNKEENDQAGINFLAEHYPVWLSDIYTLEDNYRMISTMGKIFKVEKTADNLITKIKVSFDNLKVKKGKAVYLIWNDPMMAAGKKTFIDHMLEKAGFENLVKSIRYPELNSSELLNLNPDYLLLSSEPFPFKQKHIDYFKELLPNSQIRLVDGELFSWYGSRLVFASEYFQSIG